jgi:predicted Zn-dependent peptidase
MRTVKLDERLYRSEAENGVLVLSEQLPWVRSVAVGIWVARASSHEQRSKMGISHLLEHMVFKGTERRSARDIALELEVRGGALDAYTSRDHTSFQARVLDEDLPRALDVLTDLVRNPLLRGDDLDRERLVVLEEISSVQDTPDDLVFELHAQTMWPDHPYGYSVLGTKETVRSLTTADLRDLHAQAYHPRQIVIAAAGSVDHELLLKLLAKCGWFTFDSGPEPQQAPSVPSAVRTRKRFHRDGEQVHVVIGTDTFRFTDERRHSLLLINSVLGSGMSSTLFQRVREELGLAYSVFSYQSFFKESGVVGVYVGTHPANVLQSLDVIRTELAALTTRGLDSNRLAEAKQQLKGQITLSLESPSARMYRLATIALFGEPYRTIDALLEQIDAISPADVAGVGQEFFDPDRQTIVELGPS